MSNKIEENSIKQNVPNEIPYSDNKEGTKETKLLKKRIREDIANGGLQLKYKVQKTVSFHEDESDVISEESSDKEDEWYYKMEKGYSHLRWE